MSGFNAARQMGNSHQSAQEAVKRLPGLDYVKKSRENPLFRLVSKQAMHRVARETPATGDLNTLADFTYDPKATDTTADRIDRYLFRMLVVIR